MPEGPRVGKGQPAGLASDIIAMGRRGAPGGMKNPMGGAPISRDDPRAGAMSGEEAFGRPPGEGMEFVNMGNNPSGMFGEQAGYGGLGLSSPGIGGANPMDSNAWAEVPIIAPSLTGAELIAARADRNNLWNSQVADEMAMANINFPGPLQPTMEDVNRARARAGGGAASQQIPAPGGQLPYKQGGEAAFDPYANPRQTGQVSPTLRPREPGEFGEKAPWYTVPAANRTRLQRLEASNAAKRIADSQKSTHREGSQQQRMMFTRRRNAANAARAAARRKRGDEERGGRR